jgi:hypothetical protein
LVIESLVGVGIDGAGAVRDWPDDRFSRTFENRETRAGQLEASG